MSYNDAIVKNTPSQGAQVDSLNQAWHAYRRFARHARETKQKLDRSRRTILFLGLSAAALGLGCEIVRAFSPQLAGALGTISIACVVSAVIAGEVFSRKDWQSRWVRCRSLAESIKCECYRCAVAAGKYGQQPERISQEVAEMTAEVTDLGINPTPAPHNADGSIQKMTIDEYVQQRVIDQIERFYLQRHCRFEREIARAKAMLLVLAIIAVIFGILGVLGFELFATAIGLVTSLSAAIGVLVYAARQPYLSLSYSQAATALRRAWKEWEADRLESGDIQVRNLAFVEECERIISSENNDWRIVAALEDS